MASAQSTTDHDTIRQWAEERGGRPAKIDTGGKGGILRIDFGDPEDEFEEITWEEFFEIFDENKLTFLYQEKQEGSVSRFSKFVNTH